MRMREYVRNLKIPAHGWGNRRTLSGLQDVKPRKQRICNSRFEREIVREFFFLTISDQSTIYNLQISDTQS